ncbi:hypothetical protein ACFY3G_31845 [Streptomyces phaeochromogenes]
MNRPRVVIVGAGFAGHQTARTLSRPVGAAPDEPAVPGPVRPVEGES